MARLTQAPMTPRRSVSNPNALVDLDRLLSRMQQNILHANAERERRLRTSEYERNKVEVNLEYARTLLTKLEQDALTIKVHARRQEVQADLNRQREIFEQITERLHELEDIGVDSDEDSSEGEDLLGEIIQTPSDSMEDSSTGELKTEEQPPPEPASPILRRGKLGDEEKSKEIAEQVHEVGMPSPGAATAAVETHSAGTGGPEQLGRGRGGDTGTKTSQTLRSRTQAQEPQVQTDTAESTARAQLFGNRPASATTAVSTTATTEAILDHQRAEQDQLTESLVDMASRLKAQSKAFSSSLEEDKDVISAAGTGLEKNERGLDAASRRMGTLRRMSEGKGWLGRMMLYAWIFGLMVLATVIVFVLPKLRF